MGKNIIHPYKIVQAYKKYPFIKRQNQYFISLKGPYLRQKCIADLTLSVITELVCKILYFIKCRLSTRSFPKYRRNIGLFLQEI